MVMSNQQNQREKKQITPERIIILLLQNTELKQEEIADYCGLEYKNYKTRYVTEPLRVLNNKKFLTFRKDDEKKVGRPKRIYRIERNFTTLKAIYSSYPDIQPHFQESPWLIELIIQKRLNIGNKTEGLKDDMRIMLKKSRTFFETFLKRTYNQKNLLQLQRLVYNPAPDERWFYEDIDGLQKIGDVSYIVYILFAFCIYAEYLWEQPKSWLPKDIKDLLENMSENGTKYPCSAQKNQTTMEISDALLKFWSVYKNNSNHVPQELDDLLYEYSTLREQYHNFEKTGEEVNRKYNEIADKLDLPKRDRTIKLK